MYVLDHISQFLSFPFLSGVPFYFTIPISRGDWRQREREGSIIMPCMIRQVHARLQRPISDHLGKAEHYYLASIGTAYLARAALGTYKRGRAQ